MQVSEAQIEIWKTTIQTQQHFNDLQLRLRSFFIPVYAGILTAAAYALKEHANVRIGNCSVTLASIICMLGLVMIAAFYYTDWGYHQLLRGAVKHALNIEKGAIKDLFPDNGLTHSISESSSKSKFLGLIPTHSQQRISWFYGSLFLIMAGAAAGANWVSVGSRQTVKAQSSIVHGAAVAGTNGYVAAHALSQSTSPPPNTTTGPATEQSPTPTMTLQPETTPGSSVGEQR